MEEVRHRTATRIRLRGGTVLPQGDRDLPRAPAKVGRYEILSEIGKGAMGMVYKARDPLLDRIVALKTLLAPGYLGKEVRKSFIERFEREAKAAGRMAHPHIVTIFDVGLDAENPYLVMEYVPGETLAGRLDRGRIPLAEAVACAANLANALGFAHSQRIAHRDVKPANVLDAGSSGWKLADFGIARLPDSDLTQVGIFVGTPGYAPPEVVRGGRYTPAGDVFAWGAVAYELFTGQIPYAGEDPSNVNQRVLAGPPAAPESFDPSLPRPLAQVIMRAMAHHAEARYTTGVEVLAALDQAYFQVTGGPLPGMATSSGGSGVQQLAPAAAAGRPVSGDFPSELPTEISERVPGTDVDERFGSATTPHARLPDSDDGAHEAPHRGDTSILPDTARGRVEAGRGRAATPSRDELGTVAGTPVAKRRSLPEMHAPQRRLWPWILLTILLMTVAAGAAAVISWRMAKKTSEPGQTTPAPENGPK